MHVRQRNAEHMTEKQYLAHKKKMEEQEAARKIAAHRKNQQDAIRNNQMNQAEKNYREAERLKAETQQHEEMIMIQKRTDELKAQSMRQNILN